MPRTTPIRQFSTRTAKFEQLESRCVLSSQPCLLDVPPLGEAARAVQAVNCFGADLYSQLQQAPGNLFFSPLSVTTALAMTYAGAAGQTAAEMEEVLHLGTAPGVHESFAAMLGMLAERTAAGDGFTLELANAIWPQLGLPLHNEFVEILQTDYDGAAQSLDYSDPEAARQIINAWVEDKTHGRVPDLLKYLDPSTIMVLTNSIYFKANWTQPFDPESTNPEGQFHLESGATVEVPMMYTSTVTPLAYIDGFQVVELPLEWGRTSMVVVLPDRPDVTPNQLTPELLVKIDDWLEGPRTPVQLDLYLPKFTTTVSAQLEELLAHMGMASAFSGAADFSNMTTSGMFIDQVRHKAFFEMNERGTEAAAATAVSGVICFAAGTPVLTPDGEVPVEQIKAGDYVVSKDESDVGGKVERKPVEATFRRHAELLHLYVAGHAVRATREHPFFVQGQGWTPLGELRAGDLLATDEGSWIAVERVETSGKIEPVYNFRVADFHTYFVGGRTWRFALWTHNNCVPSFEASHPFHFFIRDNVSTAVLFMGRVDDPTQAENELEPGYTPSFARSVSGTLYYDADQDGTRDSAEPPLEGWTVFIDADRNGFLHETEVRATTGPDGSYLLRPTLFSGSVAVAAAADVGEFPSREVTLAAGQHATGLNIGSHTQGRKILPEAIELDASSGDDTLLLRRNGDHVEVFLDDPLASDPAISRPISAISSIRLRLLAGNDEVVVDYTGGNPLPDGGLYLDVGAGRNQLGTTGQARGDIRVTGGEVEIVADPGHIGLVVGEGATVRLNSSAHLRELHVTDDGEFIADGFFAEVVRASAVSIGPRGLARLRGVPLIVDDFAQREWIAASLNQAIYNGRLRDGDSSDLQAQVNDRGGRTPYVTTYAGEEINIDSVVVARPRRTGLAGDYDGNGVVSQRDLDLVLAYWGADASTPLPGWRGTLRSGAIDQDELDAVLLNWGRSSSIPPF